VIADARAVAARWPDPRRRMLAEIACTVTEAPWALSPGHHRRARDAGLSNDELLHAIALAAFFGHMNRIADAVAVPLDYPVRQLPPHAEPATPPLPRAPGPLRGTPALAIEARPASAAALTAWRDYLVDRDPANRAIAGWVAALLGDGEGGGDSDSDSDGADGDGEPAPGADAALRRLVEQVTLAPWQLGDASFAPLRALGHDDAAVFAVCAAASSFGVFSRLRVAVIALGT
jgi:alkylhydroperoxidase family enzyme